MKHWWIAQCCTLTWGVWEILVVNLGGDPSSLREHSEYAEPIPSPAPKATDAQRVAGLPNTSINIIYDQLDSAIRQLQSLEAYYKIPQFEKHGNHSTFQYSMMNTINT